MDFAMLPPEINSGLLYTGPGSGPMLAAAEAWEGLAAELHSAAGSYESVVTGISAGPWLGPSSATMTAAASSYVAWMSSTAAQAEQAAGQAAAAAAAYEAAFAATVPPEVVAGNRSLLMSLVATNLFGQNTPAIATTEVQYAEMWAQDVEAMFGYAGSAASATQVTPFSSPPQTTNAEGVVNQTAAAGQAGATSAGSAQSMLSQLQAAFSAVPNALSNLTSADVFGSLTPLDLLDLGADFVAFGVDAPVSPLAVVSLPLDMLGAQTGLHTDQIVEGWAEAGLPGLAGGASTPLPAVTPGTVSAALGEADTMGALSVPPTWMAGTPALRAVALPLPAVSAGVDQQALAGSMESAFSNMTLANAAGRAVSDTLGARGRAPAKEAPARVRVMAGEGITAPAEDKTAAASEDADPQGEPRTVVTGIAAEIRDFARLRDEGLISDEEFGEQRNRLLGR
jgi:PPE-repeat protein